MSPVNTVRGPVSSIELGVTLMHEHIFVLSPEIMANYPDAWGDEELRVADAVARLTELKARGVDTIVDLTVIGLGRYLPRVVRVAAQTELNIVVATGVYTYNDVPMYFHFTGPGTGADVFLPFEDRVNTVATMCERGHADRLVLSHDASCFIDWLPEEAVAAALPNWHYLHIHNDVLPALRRRGVTSEQIDAMLIHNPRKIFDAKGAY